MPAKDQIALALDLKETNRRVDFWMNSLKQVATSSEADSRIVTPQQINGLLSELMTAGRLMRELPATIDEKMTAEVNVYRAKIEHLRDLLPGIQHSLLEERSRLEQERARVQAASQWASMSRQTR